MSAAEERLLRLEQSAGEATAIATAALAVHEEVLAAIALDQPDPGGFLADMRQRLGQRIEPAASSDPGGRAAAARTIAYIDAAIAHAARAFRRKN